MPKGNGTNGNGVSPEVALVVAEKEALQKDVLSLESKVKSLKIVDEETRKHASFLLTAVNDAIKGAEAKRKTFVDPLNATVKRINAEFKLITDPLTNLKSIINNEQIRDYNEQEKARKEAEEKARKEAEEKQRKLDARLNKTKNDEHKELLELEKANVDANLNDKLEEAKSSVQRSVFTGVGTTTIKKIWTYEVTDLSKVPEEYKMLNETKVGQVVRAGVREIPGIRIYEKPSVSSRG